MINLKERQEVIEYSIKLNTTNLSPLRSGNISVRAIENGLEGFYITPSGKKYETLKPEDVVFLSLSEEKDFISWFNSPGHCKNMFNPDHRLVGIGYIHIPGSENPHCWTTDFSR